MDVIDHTTCRICPGELDPLLDLGAQHLSDFLTPGLESPHPAVPLALMRCDRCGLVQLKHTVPSDWLYRHYWYQSGINEQMISALDDLVEATLVAYGDGPPMIWIDIGANDGTLLRLVGEKSSLTERIAFEPAFNLQEKLRPHAECVYPTVFSTTGWYADVISSVAMFYDLEDPHTFVEDVRQSLAPNGLWVIQMAALHSMLQTNDVGNICHEHLEYYSLGTLTTLLNRHALTVVDVTENTVNGGSLRVFVRHTSAAATAEGEAREAGECHVEDQLALEQGLGLDTIAPYRAFWWRAEENKRLVRSTIRAMRKAGRTVDVYGASTKGNTLLQYYDLDHRWIRQAIERSPEKVGLVTVGTDIPIVSEETGRADPAALWLCLPWHFRKGILPREETYLRQGGRILFPLPAAEIVGVRA